MAFSAWTCSLAVLALTVAVIVADEKRQDYGAAPFVLGSRYGRSPPRLLAPRNDRFFMGSRYGKRSSSPLTRSPSSSPLLVCELSPGTADLYRCVDVKMSRRGEDEAAVQE